MANWKIVAKSILIGIGLISLYFILQFSLVKIFGIELEFLDHPMIFVAIIITALIFMVSALLPFTWGKALRYAGYFFLFIFILVLELNLFKTVFKEYKQTEFTLEKCTTLFGTKERPTHVTDAIAVWSCTTNGYFPAQEGDLGWTIFTIFYIILPFAFVFVFLYGIITKIGIEDLLGNIGRTAAPVIAFIISMYASRQLFGFFLLDMYGYGAWGLLGVIGAAFFVKALQHTIENWYKIEEYGKELEDAIKVSLNIEKNAKKTLYQYVEEIKDLKGASLHNSLKSIIGSKGTLQYQAYSNLSHELQSEVEKTIYGIMAGKKSINDLLNLLK